jgi:hypothetical protein
LKETQKTGDGRKRLDFSSHRRPREHASDGYTAYLDVRWSLMTNPIGSTVSMLIVAWPLFIPAVVLGGLAALLNQGMHWETESY